MDLARDAREVGPLPEWHAEISRWLARQRKLIEWELGRRVDRPGHPWPMTPRVVKVLPERWGTAAATIAPFRQGDAL